MTIPDFDDIIFEKLNKEYGAYPLRKKYNKVVIVSTCIACLIGNLVVLIPYFTVPVHNSKDLHPLRYVTMENLMPPTRKSDSPLGPAPVDYLRAMAPAKIIPSKVKYLAPEIVDSIIPVIDTLISAADSLSEVIPNEGLSNGIKGGKGTIAGGGGPGGEGGGGTGGNGFYSNVDVMPTFKGGDIEKFRKWVQKNTKYPMAATTNGIHGKVYVTFVINKDGSVINVKVVRGVDPLIDDEALKAVKSSPKWTPGKLKGKVVMVSYLISVNFEL